MIKVTNLYKAFDNEQVLEDINLEVKTGEIMAILGGSGEGKSVFLKHLIGLLKPDQGQVFINGVDIAKLDEGELLQLRKNIGYLFQEGALYDFMTVAENVGFPLREHTTLTSKEIKEKVKKTLDALDLKDVEDKFPAELSGGMKKRVALARAIILDSKILLCDEPTSGLDPIRSRDISNLIRDVSKKLGCTTVMTSHDIDNSLRVADRLALIQDCRLIAVGTRQELEASTNSFVQEFIG
ncbi:MAG TPA: ABC transporter ATP-binding protein [Candidatus Omnitrophota bacterium]|nr:ABC transporter ATP-binding protein [Candidatus Omnitrophota bacterium]